MAFREYGLTTPHLDPNKRINFDLVTRTLTQEEAMSEADRCLYCDEVCDVCVSVCPNLANLSYMASPKSYPVYSVSKTETGVNSKQDSIFKLSQEPQIINIGDFCNECGNCTTFCPTSGDPYKTKPQFYLSKQTYDLEEKGYWIDGKTLFSKNDGIQSSLKLTDGSYIYNSEAIDVKMDSSNYEILSAQFANGKSDLILSHLAEMISLFENLNQYPLLVSGES
jgi:putative selenate reductase